MRDIVKRTACLLTALTLCLGLLSPALAAGEERTVRVGTARELLELARSCTLDTWSEGLTVVLTDDIDLGGAAFSPIPVFRGTLDGAGHRISGFTFTGRGSDVGLIRYLQAGAVVRDLTVSGRVEPEGSRTGVGLLAGQNEGLVLNCVAEGRTSGGEDVGGLVGINGPGGVVRNSLNRAEVTGTTHTGGIAGRNEGLIESCTNRGEINTRLTETGADQTAASLAERPGRLMDDSFSDTGGVAGLSSGSITGCVNFGAVGYKHTGYNAGGIAGRQDGNVVGCENHGEVQGRKDVGGIVGQFEPYTVMAYGEDPMQKLDDELGKLSGLMTRFADQINETTGSAVDDLKIINDAMSAIQDTTHTSGGEGREDLRGAYDGIYEDAQAINSALDALLGEVENFSDSANQDLDEITTALGDMADGLDDALASVESGLNEARQYIDDMGWFIELEVGKANGTGGILGEISGIKKDIAAIRDLVSDAIDAVTDGDWNALEGISDRLRAIHIEDHIQRINQHMENIAGDLKSMWELVNDAYDDSVSDASAAWKRVDKAVDRLQKSADDLNGHTKNFSDASTAYLRTVNQRLDSIEDTLKEYLDTLSDKSGTAVDDINAQLEIINGQVDRMTEGANTSNSDLHATTGDIIDQLNSIRAAITALGEKPEKSVDDVSDSVEQEGDKGRVISCRNQGSVGGDANVGGVAGIVSPELSLDPEQDLDVGDANLLVDTTAIIKATIRACENSGGVTARNECAGGILGRGEVGAVLDCLNTGDIDGGDGSHVGGIAGLSKTTIRRGWALCRLTGADYIGGAAGEGHDLQRCYTMVIIDSDGGEKLGAIAGAADGVVKDNYFVREDLAGIDGVDYDGRAVPLDYDAFIQLEGIPQVFKGFDISFVAEGRTIKTLHVDYGGSIPAAEVPLIPEKEGCYGAWEVFERDCVTRGAVVNALYSPWVTSISTGEDQPILLVEGAFSPEAVLTAEEWTPEAGGLPTGVELVGGYTFAVDDQGEKTALTVRVRCGEEEGEVRVAAMRGGRLVELDAAREGSYLVFSLDEPAPFVLMKRPVRVSVWVTLTAAAVVITLVLLLLRRGKKKRAPTAKQPEPTRKA